LALRHPHWYDDKNVQARSGKQLSSINKIKSSIKNEEKVLL
jgi:hypothetical protein